MPAGRGAEAYLNLQDMIGLRVYLNGLTITYEGNMKPALHVEMQDNMGGWRVEPTWPVNDKLLQLPIGEGLNVVSGSDLLDLKPVNARNRILMDSYF